MQCRTVKWCGEDPRHRLFESLWSRATLRTWQFELFKGILTRVAVCLRGTESEPWRVRAGSMEVPNGSSDSWSAKTALVAKRSRRACSILGLKKIRSYAEKRVLSQLPMQGWLIFCSNIKSKDFSCQTWKRLNPGLAKEFRLAGLRKRTVSSRKVVQRWDGHLTANRKTWSNVCHYEWFPIGTRRERYRRDTVDKLGNNNPTKGSRCEV